jgi:hypothetical protein
MSNLALVLAFSSALALFSTTALAGESLDDEASAHPCADEYASALQGDDESVQEAFGCWQREIVEISGESSDVETSQRRFGDNMRKWAEGRHPTPAFRLWALPSAGVWPHGAAPGLPGVTTFAVTAGAGAGNLLYDSQTDSALTGMISHVVSPRMSFSAGGGRFDSNKTVGAGAMVGRVMFTNPMSLLRFAVVAGAGGVMDLRGRARFWPIGAASVELDTKLIRFDASIGFPLITEGGVSLFMADRHHVVRLGWTVVVPTLGYRYVTERYFIGVEFASLLVYNGVLARVGWRLGTRHVGGSPDADGAAM